MKIKLDKFSAVSDFIKLTQSMENDILVKHNKYVVDGKSPMGLYSLDLSKELDIEIIPKNPNEVELFVKTLDTLGILVH